MEVRLGEFEVEAIILAGGLGTRLREIVPDVPKPMAPVAGRPFLELLLTNLAMQNFKRAVISLGYLSEAVINYFGKQFHGMQLEYAVEEQPLGTGGAIRFALTKISSDHVFVFNGDTYLEIDIGEVEALWQRNRMPIIVGCHVPDAGRYGTLITKQDKVVGFAEKGHPGSGLINGGCYVLNAGQFDMMDECETFSMEKDFLPLLVSTLPVNYFVTEGRFIDIGIPEDYNKAQVELLDIYNDTRLSYLFSR